MSFPTDSLLEAERETHDLEVWVQAPVGATFFYFALLRQCWQDPATIWQKRRFIEKL